MSGKLCPNCWKNEAILKDLFGLKDVPTYCSSCQERLNTSRPEGFGSGRHIEFTSQEIKDGRKIYQKELTQPFRQGEFSKEFRDYFPEQSQKMVQSGAITREQYANAKPVWGKDVF